MHTNTNKDTHSMLKEECPKLFYYVSRSIFNNRCRNGILQFLIFNTYTRHKTLIITYAVLYTKNICKKKEAIEDNDNNTKV